MKIVIESRIETPRIIGVLVPVVSGGLALVFGGILRAVVGADPIETYSAMAEGAFGSPEQWKAGQYYSITETLVKAIPLMPDKTHDCFTSVASNHPHLLFLLVTVPNSLPLLPILFPISFFNSVGNGPSPTLVV